MKDESSRLQLVIRLHQKTKDGELRWEATAVKGAYQTSFPENSVTISREMPSLQVTGGSLRQAARAFGEWTGAMMPTDVISIHGSDAELIESFSAADFSPDVREQAARELRLLYDEVRSQALGGDEAVGKILQALGG